MIVTESIEMRLLIIAYMLYIAAYMSHDIGRNRDVPFASLQDNLGNSTSQKRDFLIYYRRALIKKYNF